MLFVYIIIIINISKFEGELSKCVSSFEADLHYNFCNRIVHTQYASVLFCMCYDVCILYCMILNKTKQNQSSILFDSD